MDVIYFFYGFSFVVMGVVIATQPKRGSGFKLARGLWFLAGFGIFHGAHEFFEMWAIIRNIKSPAFHAVDWLCLIVSFACLLEAGRKFAEMALPACPGWQKRFFALPAGRLLAAVAALIIILSSLSSNFWATANILTRYFIGLPGSLLTGVGLLGYFRLEERVLSPLRVRRFFLLSGLGFILYGVLAGVFVSRGSFFPADWLNGDTFRAMVGLPPQLFRALCALAISWGIIGMLKIFVWEMAEKVDSALVESLPDLIFHISPEGKLIGMNRSACSFYALGSPVEVMGKDAASFIVENRGGMEAALRQAAAGQAVPFEYGSVAGSGKGVQWSAIASPVRGSDGAVKSVLVVSRDITEPKLAAAINEAHEMQVVLNALLTESLKNVPLQKRLADHLARLLAIPWLSVEPKGAVFLMDGAGKTLTLTAQQGLAPALLISCANVPLGRCLCGKAAELRRVVTSKGVGPEHEIACEGIVPHGCYYCAPIMAGGKVLGVLCLYLKEGAALNEKQEGFIKAVTDILAVNIVHEQVEVQLGQSQKMDSVGRLAGGVAHDFNNLLTAINGYSQFVMDALPKDDPKREDVKEILAAGARAAALTRQLLAFSRKQILNPQVLDLNAAIGGTVKMLQRLIGEDITLETRLVARPLLVKVDAGQIDQVLLNLAVNARDAMPKGGKLAFESGIAAADEGFLARHPDMPPGPLVCLSVCDTGCGMTEEVKAHLFEPFFTTKEKGKGTGLGLSMVYGIIKQSGGEIEVESVPDRGATFRIFLPQQEAEAQDKAKDEEKRDSLRGDETILFVEDEDVLRRLGERALIANGYTVLTAADGPEALKVVERQKRALDLLITDVVMPGMSGRDLARAIAKKNMVRRTLFISGFTDDAIVRHGVLEPGLAFLYKPFSPEVLLRKLREVLDGPADRARA